MRRPNPSLIALTSAGLALAACASGDPQDDQRASRLVVRGEHVAQTRCASCHAIGAVGESPAPEAPAFRALWRDYRVATLEEALRQGVSTGHPAMPEMQLSDRDVEALVAYLQSVQPAPSQP